MRSFTFFAATVLLIGPAIADSAFAQAAPAAQPAQQNVQRTLDPNEIICEKQSVVGSRLAHRKVCLTRAQWDDTRRQDRQEVEKAQTQRGMSGGGG
jgi:hypothetical protein